MTPEGFYWTTISAILFSMIFACKEGVATLITVAAVGIIYASGTIGDIYTTVYSSFENNYIIDILCMSVLLGLIYVIWTVFFTISEIISKDRSLVRYLSDVGTTFLSFLCVGFCAYIYLILYYNAASIVSSLAIPIIIFAFSLGSSSSKDKNGDDFLTFALICSILLFGLMYWFNNLLEDCNVVMASGCHIYNYTYGASFIPASFLIIPIFLAIRFIGQNLIEREFSNNKGCTDSMEVIIHETENGTE